MPNRYLKVLLRYALIGAAVLAFSAFLFIGWIESKMESVARDALGATLTYKSVSWGKEAIVLSDVVLERKNSRKGVDFRVQFDHITIHYALELFKRQIAFNLQFDHPAISISKIKNEIAPWQLAQARLLDQISKLRTSREPFFKVSVDAFISEGLMELIEEKGSDLIATTPVHLVYQGWEAEQPAQKPSQVGIEDVNDERAQGITIRLEKKADGVSKQVVFDNVDCKEVTKFAEFLAGPIFDPWKWHHGTLQGNFTLNDSEGTAPFVQGTGVIHDARIDHTASGMGAYFKEMKLELTRRSVLPEVRDGSIQLSAFENIRYNTKGEMKLTQPASFFRNLDRASQWILKDIMGSIILGDEISPDQLHWAFNGSLTTYEEPDAKIELKGTFPIAFKQGQQGKILVTRNCPEREIVSTELLITSKDATQKDVELSVHNWGPQEFDVVQHLWPNFDFFGKDLHLSKGTLSAKVHAHLDDTLALTTFSALSSVYASEIKGNDLEFSWNFPELRGHVGVLTGWMNLAVVEKNGALSLSLQGSELVFAEGEINREGSSRLENHSFPIEKLSDFSGAVSFFDGALQKGAIRGELAGLDTEISFHGCSSDSMASIHIHGEVADLAAALPFEWGKDVQQGFADDQFSYEGGLKKTGEGVEAFGCLKFHDPRGSSCAVDINAYFERVAPAEWKGWKKEWSQMGISSFIPNSLSTANGSVEKDIALCIQPIVAIGSKWSAGEENPPASDEEAAAAVHRVFLVDWLEDSSGPWGIRFNEGQFTTEQLPMERYLSCFLFPDNTSSIRGSAKFHGKFDDSTLLVQLNAVETSIETPYYNIQLEEIGSLPGLKNSLGKGSAYFYFDFAEGAKYGNIPVANASFYEKKHDLLFTDISAQVYFEGDKIRIADVCTISDTINLEGNVDLDFSDPLMTQMVIETDRIFGSTYAAMNFSSHFSESEFWKTALHGQFESGKKGFFLQAAIPVDPEVENTVNWKIKGRLSRCSYSLPDAQGLFSDLTVDMDYQSYPNILHLSNIYSKLVLGKDNRQDIYEVKDSHMTLREFPDSQAVFDIQLQSNGKDFARFVGGTKALNASGGGQFKDFNFDQKLTYFGNIYPNIHSLRLSDWSELVSIHAMPEMDVSTLFDELKRLSKTGWLDFPADLFTKVTEGSPQGRVFAKIDTKMNGALFDFEAFGSGVNWKGKPIGRAYMKGMISKDGSLHLNDAVIDSISVKAEIQKKPDQILIRKVQVSQGGGLFISLNGEYLPASHTCLLNVDSCVADFSQLQSIPKWKNLLEPWQPRGMAKISGNFKIAPEQDSDKIDISGHVRASIDGLEIRGMPVNNTGPIDFSFSSKEGLRIQGIDFRFQRSDQTFYHANLALKSAKYEVEGEHLSLEGLNFTLSSTCLSQLALIGRDLFPDLFAEGTIAFLKDFQCEGGLTGSLQMRVSPNDTKVGLRLRDGHYLLWGKEYDLQNVFMDFDSTQICFRAQYTYHQHPFGITVEIDRNTMQRGRVLIRDLKDSSADSYAPLAMYWEGDVHQGIAVKQVVGKIAGLEFNLIRPKEVVNDPMVVLQGYVKLQDGVKLSQILPLDYRCVIDKLELKNNVELRGRFATPKDRLSNITFQGMLWGRKFPALGCILESMSANVYFSPSYAAMTNFKIIDEAGKLTIPEIAFGPDRFERWMFNIPKIELEMLKLGQLRRQKSSNSLKRLVIEEATLNNLRGYLSDSNTYTGTGSFYFENLSKKNFLERTLLLLPAEIIGRIGLNTNVLVPAMGTIVFSLKNGRVYLDKLKDVYSEGKLSRFYLPSGDKDSYVDYDGNLHINIRMKQYNLLFKIVELAQISVRGTMGSPSCSLQKRVDPNLHRQSPQQPQTSTYK